VFQVKPEEVVPLDDVRVAFLDFQRQFLEHVSLSQVVPGDDAFPARLVRQRDGDDAIPWAVRVREFKSLRRVSLDVELETLELLKSQAQEVRLPSQHKVLDDRVVEVKIRRV